jgi:NodT family efflux transporter outer membrane factor (OMF) lipoprotein
LLERRPDIAAAERQVAAANAEIGVAKAAYYPTLSLSASAGFQTAHALEWFNWPSRFWSVGTTMSQTVFDGGLRRAQVAQAQASYEGTVANYRQTVLTAFQGVEDQLAALRILSNEIEQQHTAVASANHYLDLSLTRYRAGVDSYLSVITAQNAVLTNRVTELQIELRQMVASVSLVMDLGGGWDPSRLPTVQDVRNVSKAVPDQGSVKAQAVATPNPPPLPAPAK